MHYSSPSQSWFSSTATSLLERAPLASDVQQLISQPLFCGFSAPPLLQQLFIAKADADFSMFATSDVFKELSKAREAGTTTGLKRLPYTFARHFAMHGMITLQQYINGALEAEQTASDLGQEPEYPEFPDFTPPLINSVRGTVREFMVTYIVKPQIEKVAQQTLPLEYSSLLLTPPRPGLRFLSVLIAHKNPLLQFAHYARDAFVGNTLLYVSDFLVHLCQLGYRIFYNGGTSFNEAVQSKVLWRAFRRDAAVYGIRCVVMLAAGAVGAAAGTLLRPGVGTSIGLTVGELGGAIVLFPIVTPYLLEPIV